MWWTRCPRCGSETDVYVTAFGSNNPESVRQCPSCGRVRVPLLRYREHECQQCGYDLRRNSSGDCPECGWSIPSPMRTFLVALARKERDPSA